MSFPVRILVVAFVLCFGGLAISAESRVYVSLLRDRKIVWFARDADSGLLVREGEVSCPAEPAFLNSSHDGRLLFVAFRSTGQLASYRVDSASGKLTLLNAVSGGDDPAYLQTDRTGKFLYVAGQASGKIAAYRIEESGRLRPLAAYDSGPVPWAVQCVDSR